MHPQQDLALSIQMARQFQSAELGKSLFQVLTSFGGFLATSAVMYSLVEVSFWIALALAPIAAGFLVRIFIIQHDCGHFSFFRRRNANNILGMACSLLTLAPYTLWRRQHNGHHRVWNDLDRRQSGADIYSSCLTVAEYRAMGRMQRWRYRIIRHPLCANLLLPPLVFLGLYRTPFDSPKTWRRERRGVHGTNVALVVAYGGLGLLLGFEQVAAVQLPIMVMASIIGVWLFSVQHRGKKVRWFHRNTWTPVSAALEGANYLRLPAILRWFTGNIGYHHVHHLNPRIPNYKLRECHESIPFLRAIPALSFRDGLAVLRFTLWDEDHAMMTTFGNAAADGASP